MPQEAYHGQGGQTRHDPAAVPVRCGGLCGLYSQSHLRKLSDQCGI